MQLTLVVLTPGKMKGKEIPVTRSPFFIGRDAHCHVRAASLAISNRHCALTMRGSRVFVRDFNSTNGTRVNEELLVGETELKNRDRLAVGPLQFAVRIDQGIGVSQPTPLPPSHGGDVPDEIAPTVLAAAEEVAELQPGTPVDRDGVPIGDTKEEFILPPDSADAPESAEKSPPPQPR
jgi:predicted component of type VI protein secretion system